MPANHHTSYSKQNLTWHERGIVLRASLLLPLTEIRMRWKGFRKCQQDLQRLSRIGRLTPPLAVDQLSQAQRTAELVTYANRRYSVYVADCLTRSLVTQYLLRCMQIPAELKLGTRTTTGQFEAHAWVEYDGHALNELEDVQTIYSVFDWQDADKYHYRT